MSSGFLFKREEVIKKLLLFILTAVFFASYANAEDKVGMTQELGINIPFFQEYVEPEFMNFEVRFEDDPGESYGLTYNLKNAFSLGGYLNQIELDASWQYFKHDYWSNTTGTIDDAEHQIINARLLYGLQVSDKMMLKTGFGHRYHDDQGAGVKSSTGARAYDREQKYDYIPLIAVIDAPIAHINGKLNIEYDNIIYGTNLSAASTYYTFRNSDGYAWKTSYKFPFQDFYFEPYYEFMHIEESTFDRGAQEPSNYTREYGLKLSKRFGEDSLSAVADSKRLLQADIVNDFGDKFSFGFEYFQSEIDTGLFDFAGGATLDEKDFGFSILSNFKINDFVGIEAGFTEFGQVMIKSNTGGSFDSDGRWRHGGGALGIGSDNFRNTLESYTGSLAVKPNFDLGNGLFVNGDLGFHRWQQDENYRFVGASASGDSMVDYSGVDTFYGVGAGLKKDNFEVSVNYKDYDMYYDAEIIGASLKYNF